MTTSQQTNVWDFATRTGQTIALATVVCVLGWLYLGKPSTDDGKQDDKPVVLEPISKILAKCYEADRVSKIAILKGITANTFADDQAKLEWINRESETKRIADFQAYVDRLSEAIDTGKTEELAKALEAGK
ncbi:hypothetical protein VN12_19740 [Pirellula sp. SH-Sr6A]|uniref:hypothetical protein n=1 Tax=Pirellula sp. SH-Sr6A TaxID=1632865 RepID=UPI00078D8B14|nr:hypothetical protein [Pirellula sp. SH-Sr6A]AMV30869.1 hypothetical protein VN12_02050 [Pirellula sp. SH-Sr6A]AMV34368.1 hypothetical protein VN12_19740 [Pirellula sp. SH-Sr6A]